MDPVKELVKLVLEMEDTSHSCDIVEVLIQPKKFERMQELAEEING